MFDPPNNFNLYYDVENGFHKLLKIFYFYNKEKDQITNSFKVHSFVRTIVPPERRAM